MIKTVKHNKCIFDFNVLLKPLFLYMFRSHRTIIRQLNIGMRLVIELLVWIHADAKRHVYKVTELPQVIKMNIKIKYIKYETYICKIYKIYIKKCNTSMLIIKYETYIIKNIWNIVLSY
jgi:hypothetical protein